MEPQKRAFTPNLDSNSKYTLNNNGLKWYVHIKLY